MISPRKEVSYNYQEQPDDCCSSAADQRNQHRIREMEVNLPNLLTRAYAAKTVQQNNAENSEEPKAG